MVPSEGEVHTVTPRFGPCVHKWDAYVEISRYYGEVNMDHWEGVWMPGVGAPMYSYSQNPRWSTRLSRGIPFQFTIYFSEVPMPNIGGVE